MKNFPTKDGIKSKNILKNYFLEYFFIYVINYLKTLKSKKSS